MVAVNEVSAEVLPLEPKHLLDLLIKLIYGIKLYMLMVPGVCGKVCASATPDMLYHCDHEP
jgi:hypothetical protein